MLICQNSCCRSPKLFLSFLSLQLFSIGMSGRFHHIPQDFVRNYYIDTHLQCSPTFNRLDSAVAESRCIPGWCWGSLHDKLCREDAQTTLTGSLMIIYAVLSHNKEVLWLLTFGMCSLVGHVRNDLNSLKETPGVGG